MELKKRSMSTSTVMCVVLAVLLVISIALGFTGAWFTDKASGNETVNFGEVKLGAQSITITPDSATALLPSQKITLTNPQYKGVAAYYRVSVKVSGYTPAEGQATLEQLNTLLSGSTVYGYIEESATLKDIEGFPNQITIDSRTGNEFQKVSCSLVVTVILLRTNTLNL